MLTHTHPIDIETILREVSYRPPFPPAADRQAWAGARARLGERSTIAWIRAAEQAAREPIPSLPASLWLECKRSGVREGYEDPYYHRRTMMRDLVLGECLEHQGRFLDPLMDVIWAICEESSWVYPAHHTDLADVAHPYIDLGAASTGFDLAEVDSLIGMELPREAGQRIRYEVNQRLFIPYLTRHDFWWLGNTRDHKVNNWTAVCNAGVMAAAIYLEPDPARLADILAKGVRSLEDYLSTFDEDGGTSEGPGYWSYGFGSYTLIAQLVEQRTDGRLSLMDGERMRRIASFPLNTMLSPGAYVNFSDAPRHASFISAMLAFLGRRLALPGLLDLAREPFSNEDSGLNADFNWRLRSLFWDLPTADGAHVAPARHDWYSGMMWMIARCDPADPDALVLAAKGGHNGEMHNHNDVGSFIVQAGQEALISDIGCGKYNLGYFGPERYDFFVTSSLGHPVPVPNGQLQPAGDTFAAQLLEHTSTDEKDMLRLDLKDAYPKAAGLKSLERRLELHRNSGDGVALNAGWVELEDSFSFINGPGSFETALTTFSPVVEGDGAVLIKGMRGELRVGYPADTISARVELYHDIEFEDGLKDVNRVVFFLDEPASAGSIRLEIVPIPPEAIPGA